MLMRRNSKNNKARASTGSLTALMVSIMWVFLLTAEAVPQSREDCLMCHSDKELTMEKRGKEVSLFVNEKILNNSAHKTLSCVSCHLGFNPEEMPHKENIKPVDCKVCHRDAPLKHTFHPQMFKAAGTNGQPDVSCKNCHGTHNVVSPKIPGSKFHKDNLIASCGECHPDVSQDYMHSAHALAFKEGIRGAPNCIACHKSGVTSKTTKRDPLKLKIAQEKLCLSCHLDDDEVKSKLPASTGFIKAYEMSVHGRGLLAGDPRYANCIDCHNSHNVLKGSDSKSTVFKLNVPKTCSKCHEKIYNEYEESVHGKAIAKRNMDSPVCTDCHGEHNILEHTDPASPVAYKNVSAKVCSPCHSSVRLSDKYGISSNRYKTYKDSYHGLALRGGSTEVANCASCHGVHNIKPSSDPTSTINKNNLAATCGHCHPGANVNFTVGKIHVTMEKEDEPILYWIATIYVILIVSIIGAMLIHNVLDFFKKAKIKKMKQRGLIKEEKHGHALYLRMTVNERIQHASLALSFILLVITGFMLRFPESWWVSHIRDFSKDAFEYRSLLHRIAAVVMVAVSVYHLYYILFTTRGRQLVIDLLPNFKDVTDAIGIAKFNLGISKVKPKLDRFSYVEKAEYWALVWGTVIMGATGFIMWFDNTFIGLLSKLGWDIARTIHYYEAWLAFLAIVVWHFYFVIFNPDVYPMNLAWIKGTLSEEEMADEHPLELERIKKQQSEQSQSDKK